MVVFRSIIFALTIGFIVSIDVLQPISTNQPDPSFYPNIDHPRGPQRLNLGSKKPLHTNKFYTNAILGSGFNPVITHPYILLLNTEAPYGVTISMTESLQLGPNVDQTRVKYFFNHIIRNIQVSATEFTSYDAQVIEADDPGFSLTFRLQQAGSSAKITMPVVRGMAYVTYEYTSATPKISTVHAVLSVNGQTTPTQITGKKFEIVLNNGQSWFIYALNGDVTFNYRDNQLIGTGPITNVLRFAKKQSDNAANNILDQYVGVYPTSCQLKADVTGLSGSYSFLWQRKGDLTKNLLHYAFAHHRQVLDTESVSATPVQSRSSSKGMMTAYLGNTWVLNEPSLSNMSYLAPRAPVAQYEDAILTQLRKDIPTAANLAVTDYYFTGKEFHKYALLCLLADYYRETSLKEQCLIKLETGFDVLLKGQNGNALRYDRTWSGLISSSGLGPMQELADFGNSYYNDHHYHWGYFIQTGAIIAHLDPSYIPKMRFWIEGLIRDSNNPSTKDTYFPQFRYFDWFSGHSWSQGLFESADGKDQESTSEEVNYHYGLALWGAATQSATVEGLGRLMLAVSKRSIQTYFLMDSSNTVMPSEFINNKVTGIFFENKADYATWFGANPEFIHGIQMLPCTPITEEVRLKKFVEEEWNSILNRVAPGAVEGWRSILYMNYAIVDPAEAYRQLLTVPLDNGVSRTWALYWAATRPNANGGSGSGSSSTVNPGTGTTTQNPGSGGACSMPAGGACTDLISIGDYNAGYGMYYDASCSQGGVGCNHIKENCRLCGRITSTINNPFPRCPSCVPGSSAK